jgi:plasmid stabilization system protein ParE
MSGFVLHPEAYADLDEIWEYIAADNLDAADRVREEIYTAIRSLVAFPHHQGHNRPDLTTRPVRFQSLRDYIIAYVPDDKPLAVLAVLHGRRSPRVISAMLRERR